MKNITLILDTDDVLLDWTGGFASWCLRNQYISFSEDVSKRPENWVFLSGKSIDEHVLEFNISPDFERLEELPYARELVKTASKNKRIDNIVVISACGTGEQVTEEMRRRQLVNTFGEVFHSIHILPIGACKKPLISSLGVESILFDDSWRHITRHSDAGRTGVWVDYWGEGTPKNTSVESEKILHLSCFSEAPKLLKKALYKAIA